MNKPSKTILIISAAAVGAVFLIVFFYFGLFYLLYSAVENWITSRLGFDYYLARLFSTAVVIGLTALFPTLAWYLVFGKKRLYGALALIGIQAAVCLAVYTLGARVCFDRRTGKPLCYYADTEKGRVWSVTPGFEPESGKPFRLYTREMADRDAETRRRGDAANQSK